jgi:hypothetical protein
MWRWLVIIARDRPELWLTWEGAPHACNPHLEAARPLSHPALRVSWGIAFLPVGSSPTG